MNDADSSRADRDTDEKYAHIRQRFGRGSGRANGYRLHRYFVHEQALLLQLLGKVDGVVLDLACGSGLMGLPLQTPLCEVVGIDFNAAACLDSRDNGLSVVRGDAYCLPLATNSIDHAFSCQFFNQQRPQSVPQVLGELARVMKHDGRVVLVWRNHHAWVHRAAHMLYSVTDRVAARPRFPVYAHPVETVALAARDAGFSVIDQLVSFPLINWSSRKLECWRARVFGASSILVLARGR